MNKTLETLVDVVKDLEFMRQKVRSYAFVQDYIDQNGVPMVTVESVLRELCYLQWAMEFVLVQQGITIKRELLVEETEETF